MLAMAGSAACPAEALPTMPDDGSALTRLSMSIRGGVPTQMC
jgi:hypothetical protein